MAENITVDPKDAEDNKIMGILAYLGILFLVPLLAAKESPFARFHTNQGFILFLVGMVISFVAWIPVLGWIIALVGWIGILVFMILGIINAAKGEMKELPVIGKYRLLK